MPDTDTSKNQEKAGTKSDTSDYSATKAPENKEHVESTALTQPPAQLPGGEHAAPVDVGMSELHRKTVPDLANKPE